MIAINGLELLFGVAYPSIHTRMQREVVERRMMRSIHLELRKKVEKNDWLHAC
jgi:hypothetical protein